HRRPRRRDPLPPRRRDRLVEARSARADPALAQVKFLPALLLASASLLAKADENEWRPPFITTPPEVVERMLELAGTRADDLVVDLGSGDGRIVIAAARKYGARGLGIELDGKLVEKSRENARRMKLEERVRFVEGDVLRADI